MSSRLIAAALAGALALALVPPPARAADDAAAALLAKHKSYVGWQAGDGAIPSLRESGTVTYEGRVVSTIAAFHRGSIFRRVRTSPGRGSF